MKVHHLPTGEAYTLAFENDTLDAIAFRHYGSHDGTTELLYEGNPDLVRGPIRLSAGTRVFLPAKSEPAPVAQINLWD